MQSAKPRTWEIGCPGGNEKEQESHRNCKDIYKFCVRSSGDCEYNINCQRGIDAGLLVSSGQVSKQQEATGFRKKRFWIEEQRAALCDYHSQNATKIGSSSVSPRGSYLEHPEPDL